MLTKFLLNRKWPSPVVRRTGEFKTGIKTRKTHPAKPDEACRCEITSLTEPEAGSPKVSRRIAAQGLAESCAELFPDKQITNGKKKPKLNER